MKYLHLKFWVVALFSITLFSACSKDVDSTVVIDFGTAPSSSIITTGTVNVITENTVRYHTFNFATAPYTVTIVETKNNIVLIDLGPAPAFAAELKTYVNAINKPGAVIITHNHGDHYGGAGNFTNYTFYAQSAVASQLNSTSGFTSLNSKAVIGVSSSQVIGDLTFGFGKVSNSETGENGYVFNAENKALFAGDLVYNLTHPYLREYTPKDATDEIDNWVAGLNVLKNNFSGYAHIFVGHNGSRADVANVIDENISYLQNAKGIIKGTKTITGGGKATTNQKVIDELQILYPTHKVGGLLLSLPNAFFPGDTGANWF